LKTDGGAAEEEDMAGIGQQQILEQERQQREGQLSLKKDCWCWLLLGHCLCIERFHRADVASFCLHCLDQLGYGGSKRGRGKKTTVLSDHYLRIAELSIHGI
jgi:hypothetical protein